MLRRPPPLLAAALRAPLVVAGSAAATIATAYAYRRLGFGFRSGPTFQQSVTICIVRALTRRLRRGGLHTAEPPSVAHKYPHIEAKTSGKHFVNAVLAFLDDVGGFCSAQGPAWFSFCQYLLLCKELSIAVSFKPGKTEPPSSMMIYLGIVCDCQQGIVALDEDRVRDLQEKIANVKISETLTVVELQSLTGILVFCSVVIRLGRLHYHALIDAVTTLGPHPRPSDCLHMQMLRQSHRPDGEKWFRRAMQHGSRHQTFPLF